MCCNNGMNILIINYERIVLLETYYNIFIIESQTKHFGLMIYSFSTSSTTLPFITQLQPRVHVLMK